MKKFQKAFSMAEMLVVLAVISALSMLVITVMGSKLDRNKGLFKKAYSLTERIVAEIVNDQAYYPDDGTGFGFKQNNNVIITGADYCTSNKDCNKTETSCRGTVDTLLKFCNLFSYNLNLTDCMKYTDNDNGKCEFESTDGIMWEVTREGTNENKKSNFLIKIDTNSQTKNHLPNIDSRTAMETAKAEDFDVSNRDRFFIKVRYDGKVMLPKNDELAKSYLKSTDLNRE